MAHAKLKVVGTVSKLRTWSGQNVDGWACNLKDEGEYDYEISGSGTPGFSDGSTITAIGDPGFKFTMFGCKVADAPDTDPIGEEDIPFHHIPAEHLGWTRNGHSRF